jgi:hypothetical protein
MVKFGRTLFSVIVRFYCMGDADQVRVNGACRSILWRLSHWSSLNQHLLVLVESRFPFLRTHNHVFTFIIYHVIQNATISIGNTWFILYSLVFYNFQPYRYLQESYIVSIALPQWTIIIFKGSPVQRIPRRL